MRENPNIVYILADDMGYGDLSCYGAVDINTPSIDRLANEGIKFTQFYAAANTCSPSRAALLTGRYPLRSKGWSMPASEITWAELIKRAGYQTVCIGKWDVSNRRAIIDRMPNAQGFDYYFGIAASLDMVPYTFIENDRVTAVQGSLLHQDRRHRSAALVEL